MSATGDEKKTIDVKASLEAVKVAQKKKADLERDARISTRASIIAGKKAESLKQGIKAGELGEKIRTGDQPTITKQTLKTRKSVIRVKNKQYQALTDKQMDLKNSLAVDTAKIVKDFDQNTKNKNKFTKDSYDTYKKSVETYLKDVNEATKEIDSNVGILASATKENKKVRDTITKIQGQLSEKPKKPQLLEFKGKDNPFGFFTGKPSTPKEVTQYNARLSKTREFVTSLIDNDIIDAKQKAIITKQILPVYDNTVKVGEDAGTKFLNAYDARLKNYEELSGYPDLIGLKDVTGPQKEEAINKIKARFAHFTLSAAKGFAISLPTAALGAAGGPLIGGLIGVYGAASLANPKNRAQLDQYVRAHPQEFLGGLTGALLAGKTVQEVTTAYNKFTKNLKITERRKLEDQWNEIIDDYAYLEQQKGAEFPSRVTEIPEPGGTKIIIGDPINTEEVILKNFVSGVYRNKNDPAMLNSFINEFKDTDKSIYLYSNRGNLESVTMQELLRLNPDLKQPYYNPAFRDPNVLNKADLVSRSNIPGVNYTPLVLALLVQAGQKGYVTQGDIDKIVNDNSKLIEKLKKANIQIPKDFSTVDIVNKQLSDLVEIAKLDQDIIQAVAVIPDTPPIPGVSPPPEIPPPEEPIPPETPPLGLSLKQRKARSKLNLSLFRGKKRIYEATYQHKAGRTETIGPIPARSLFDAIQQAQRKRKSSKQIPRKGSIRLIGETKQ